MSRVSMLEERINGREVMAYVQGKYSYHSTSKLTRTIKALGLDPEEGKCLISRRLSSDRQK